MFGWLPQATTRLVRARMVTDFLTERKRKKKRKKKTTTTLFLSTCNALGLFCESSVTIFPGGIKNLKDNVCHWSGHSDFGTDKALIVVC